MKFFLNFLVTILIMEIIQNFVEAETIECKYSKSNWKNMNKETYYCEVKNLEIFSSGLKVTIDGVTGQHLYGYNDTQVEGIRISGAQNITFFPSNIEKVFPNLYLIEISDSKLIHITNEDLKPFPNLEVLCLHKNLFEIISEDLFIYNQKLEIIWLHNNRIKHIDSKAFNNLDKLRVLTLQNNMCYDGIGFAVKREFVLIILKLIEQGYCRLPETTTLNPLEVQIQEIEDLKNQLSAKEKENQNLLEANKQKEEENQKLKEELSKYTTFRINIEQNMKEILNEIDQNIAISFVNINEKFDNFTFLSQELVKKENQLKTLENLFNQCNNEKKSLNQQLIEVRHINEQFKKEKMN